MYTFGNDRQICLFVATLGKDRHTWSTLYIHIGEMSFLQYKKVISEGDVLIVCKVSEFYGCCSKLLQWMYHKVLWCFCSGCHGCQGFDKLLPVTVQRGLKIQVKGGAVHHSDLIGQPYGAKVTVTGFYKGDRRRIECSIYPTR